MNKYFYIENDNQFGPFSIQELKDKKVTNKTLVWTENLENWIEAENINELKEILKIIPPPIPNKISNTLKIEAEIVKKKEKIITPEREIIIAKETKQNYKFIKYSFLVGLIFFIFLIYKNDGFAHKAIVIKLDNDMNDKIEYYEGAKRKVFLQNRENLKTESFSLGFNFNESVGNYFFTSNAVEFHNRKFNEILKESILPSLLTILITSLTLIFGRYILKGAKWVEEKSIN